MIVLRKTVYVLLLGWFSISFGAEDEGVRTIIKSESLKMEPQANGYLFEFKGDVYVAGNNLEVSCQEMHVHTSGKKQAKDKDEKKKNAIIEPSLGGKFSGIGTIESIVALREVKIVQGDVEAFAERAEVLLQGESAKEKGRVILTEDPYIIGEEGKVAGWRITLVSGYERKDDQVIIESNPEDRQERSTITLESLEEAIETAPSTPEAVSPSPSP